MRIRKRPASQCGATVAAGRAGQAVKQGSNLGAQPTDYKQLMHPQRHICTAEAEKLSERQKIDHGSIAPSPSQDVGSTETSPSSTPGLAQAHDREAMLLQDNWKWRQLHVHERSSTQYGSPDATSPSDVQRIAVLPRRTSAQQLQADAECRHACTLTMATTMRKERVLQTAGQLPTCLPVTAAIHHGQVTESTGVHSQIDLDQQISSSLPLLKVDHNRKLKNQVSARIIGDSIVQASKEDTSCNENTSKKFRMFLPEVTDDVEQENIMKTATSDRDAQHGEEDNKLQGALDWGIEDHMRCGRRSGQGWQCKNKRVSDGGSIYCDYHQSKITQHRATWSTRKKIMKENKTIYRKSSGPGQSMVDVKVLELPLFPSKQHMYGNLQAQDKADAIFERMSQAASYSKVHRVPNVRTDDLDLKLAPNSEALPNLVETDMPTQPTSTQLAQNCMESPVLENFSFKRRRIEGIAISESRTDTIEHDHSLTEVNILCAGPEHLNAIRVFGSALGVMQENTTRGEISSMNRNIGISIVGDNQNARDVSHVNSVQERKSLPDRTLEQEQLVQNDNFHKQQVPHRQPNLLGKEQDTNIITARIETNEQGQQHRCKRHDGRGWRCKQVCAPGKLYCEHHARKQRSYVNQIKTENKNNGELQQHLPRSQQVDSPIADKTKSKLTGRLRQIHLEPCIKVHKAMSPEAKHEVELSQTNKKDIDDEMQGKEKQALAPLKQLRDEDELAHEVKSAVPEFVIEAESKPQVEKVVADDERKGQDRMEQVQVGSQRRCGRHDGRGWRCKSKCMPGSVYCEHHKEKLRRYHANWSTNCILKQRRGRRRELEQTVSGVASKEEAGDEDEDRKETPSIVEHVKAAASAPCKRKRRFLHNIYARCSD